MHDLKQELRHILWFVAALLVLLLIIFRAAPLGGTLRLWLSILYVLYLPGYLLLFGYRAHLDFLTRSIAGMGAAACIFIVFMYHVGIIGIRLDTYAWWLPLAVALLAVVLMKIKLPVRTTS